MKLAKIIAGIGLVAMVVALLYGFIRGDFSQDGGELLSNTWGIVSMVDLYTGFILFSAWVVYREESLILAAVWVLLIMVLGFFTASLYVLIALIRSQDDWPSFWMGKQANG